MPQENSLIGRQVDIINGPGVTALEHGMFYRHPGKPRHELTMSAEGHPVTFVLHAIGEEDGGTDNWLFYGYITEGHLAGLNVEGYYNSTRRKGWLRIFNGAPTIFGSTN